jgi:hypothetical protein
MRWLFVILPILAFTAWELTLGWDSSPYFWDAVSTIGFVVCAAAAVVRENDQRQTQGRPPMTRAEQRRHVWGSRSK